MFQLYNCPILIKLLFNFINLIYLVLDLRSIIASCPLLPVSPMRKEIKYYMHAYFDL